MKLSVIVPVFNEEKTIEKIVSLILAEKTPKEIIIIDDGSTDKTLSEILNPKSEIRNNFQNSKFKIQNSIIPSTSPTPNSALTFRQSTIPI